jgi:hypothetical protein
MDEPMRPVENLSPVESLSTGRRAMSQYRDAAEKIEGARLGDPVI